jgi:hypothetical protein
MPYNPTTPTHPVHPQAFARTGPLLGHSPRATIFSFADNLLYGQENFASALPKVLCFDSSQMFILGARNRGMLTWDLIQDNQTSSLLVAAAPMIGLPHCDYYDIELSAPVMSLMSIDDQTVSPCNLPYQGSPTDKCIANRDG